MNDSCSEKMTGGVRNSFFLLIFSSLLLFVKGFSADLSGVKTWAIQLQNIDIEEISQNNTIDLIVIDYSASGGPEAVFSPQQIAQIKNSGKIVLCYLSIGEAETYRWYWQNSWDANHDGKPDPGAPDWLGPANPDWLDNYKVRYWNPNWQAIIFQYLDTIFSQGFDGIYMDIVDAYYYWGFEVGEIPDAASRMIQFIEVIDSYSHAHAAASFYIFAQNAEAVTDESDVSAAEREAYFAAIDGIGCEGLFFQGDKDENNPYDPDDYRLNLLDSRYLPHGEVILSIEYLTNENKIGKYEDVVRPHGYLPYVSVRALDRLFDGIDIYSSANNLTIAGKVRYQDSDIPVPGVSLHLTGDLDSLQTSQTDGAFRFINLPAGGSFVLTPEKTGDISDATILSYDASLAARLAMDLFPEATAAQRLAADVDVNGAIQMYDAALIAKKAVGLSQPPESHVAQWAFSPSQRNFSNLSGDVTDADFQAVVLGDVDGNWSPPGKLGKPFALRKNLTAGVDGSGKIILDFNNDENYQIYSCDLNLRFDAKKFAFDSVLVLAEIPFQILVNSSRPGLVKIGAFGTKPIEKSGTFLKVQFREKSSSTLPEAAIEISSYRINNLPEKRGTISLVQNRNFAQARRFELYQNFPNPFNPSTTIQYDLPEAAFVSMSVYNVRGEKVAELVHSQQTPGRKSVKWNGCNSAGEAVSSGVYFYVIKAGRFESSRKMAIFR